MRLTKRELKANKQNLEAIAGFSYINMMTSTLLDNMHAKKVSKNMLNLVNALQKSVANNVEQGIDAYLGVKPTIRLIYGAIKFKDASQVLFMLWDDIREKLDKSEQIILDDIVVFTLANSHAKFNN